VRSTIGPIALVIQLGAIVTGATLLPLFIGIWLDSQFQTAPWITLIGLVAGVVGAIAGVYKVVSSLYRQSG
jgi:F0F1-type ATP synthase assembly protein I